MKIEQLLVQHFYNKKEISLQGLGIFRLTPDFVLPAENEKDIVMPENAISYEYNPKVTEDEGLIDYIVQQTRKIKPLASADLDSYLVLGKQFLNIGKPFRIEGLGVLEKSQEGAYTFHQGHYTSAKVDAPPAILKDKAEDDDISFAAQRTSSGNGRKKVLLITALVLLIGLIVWGGWYYLNKKQDQTEIVEETPASSITDTLQQVKDSTQLAMVKPDSTHPNINNPEGYTFRFVFRETADRAAAEAKMKDLITRGHHVIMITSKDSLLFKLAEPFKNPLSDTTRIKDSLNTYYYNGKGYIEVIR